MNTADPPCDFDAFVAQRRDITRDEAGRLVQSWLTHYCPRSKPDVVAGAESDARVSCTARGKENANVAPGPALGVAYSWPL